MLDDEYGLTKEASCQSGLLHLLQHVLSDQRGRLGDHDSRLLHRLNLAGSVALALLHNGTRVAHPSLGRRSEASDEADNGLVLLVVLLQPVRSHLLGLATDLADHHDTLSLGVHHESLQHIDEVSPVERITTNAHHCRLPESRLGGLVDRLIGQRSRSADDADLSSLVDVARHDADLALVRLDDPGAVGPDDSGLALGAKRVLDPDHVVLRNP